MTVVFVGRRSTGGNRQHRGNSKNSNAAKVLNHGEVYLVSQKQSQILIAANERGCLLIKESDFPESRARTSRSANALIVTSQGYPARGEFYSIRWLLAPKVAF